MTTALLFLDDERNPGDAYFSGFDWYQKLREDSIAIVRTQAEFEDWILNNPLPPRITLDHDLGDEQSCGYGMGCVKFLIDNNIDIRPAKFYFHSSNPAGRDNMASLIGNYIKHLNS